MKYFNQLLSLSRVFCCLFSRTVACRNLDEKQTTLPLPSLVPTLQNPLAHQRFSGKISITFSAILELGRRLGKWSTVACFTSVHIFAKMAANLFRQNVTDEERRFCSVGNWLRRYFAVLLNCCQR